jgi:hypothetical protein
MESQPLLNRDGALFFCTLQYCIQKREEWSPVYKCRGFGVYSMNKTGSGMKMFPTRDSVAS